MIKVVNVNNECCTHYCGRKSSYIPTLHGVDLTVLGNPYKRSQGHTRAECINLYETYIWNLVDGYDKTILDAFRQMYEFNGVIKLGCFCKPKRCHCDILTDVYLYLHPW